MRIPVLATALASLCLALPTTAQKVQVFGEKNGVRAATTQILFGQNLVGGMSIEYGQPMWKAEYDKMLDQLKGRMNRLGKDWWTTMTTSFPLEVGGTKVPAGSYLLALHCDKDGKFSLAFLESTKGIKGGALPFAMSEDGAMNWKPDFLAPLLMKKNASDDIVEKMKMTLSIDGETLAGSYTLAWGPHQLSAEVAVKAGGADGDGDHKDGDGERGKSGHDGDRK